MAHIANRKDSRNIGFEQKWISIESPSLWTLPVAYMIRAGQQEATVVPLDEVREPIGPPQIPYKDKHRTHLQRHNLPCLGAQHRNLCQVGFAVRIGYAGIRP